MKILFANFSALPFDVTTPETAPLGGSESCVAYLATELAKTHDVALLANTTDAVSLRCVRHFRLTEASTSQLLARQRFDVIVVVNAPSYGPLLRQLSPASRLILWNHHAPDQPAIQPLAHPEVRRAFELVVYVSEWQRALTEARFADAPRSHVIGNGLTPSFERMFTDASELMATKQWRAAYTSTPFRGLDLLLDVYRRLDSPPTLEVFSSMRVYRGDDTPFAAIYADARSQAAVRYHGSVAQTQLAAAMREVSFFCYPSVFPETFCIAALEAMAAGALVISTDLAALASTTMGFARLMPIAPMTRQEFLDRYQHLYGGALDEFRADPVQWAERMFAQSTAVNSCATWRHRAQDWLQRLTS